MKVQDGDLHVPDGVDREKDYFVGHFGRCSYVGIGAETVSSEQDAAYRRGCDGDCEFNAPLIRLSCAGPCFAIENKRDITRAIERWSRARMTRTRLGGGGRRDERQTAI